MPTPKRDAAAVLRLNRRLELNAAERRELEVAFNANARRVLDANGIYGKLERCQVVRIAGGIS